MISSSIQTVKKPIVVKEIFSFMHIYLKVAHYFPFGTPLTMVGLREKTVENIVFNVLFGIIK